MSRPDRLEFLSSFAQIGVMSFGGPAAQISLMHDQLVTRRGWLSEAAFLRALSLCMLLPGPEAMQLATYAGWRLRGTFGGLVAGLLFVLPGALVIAALAVLYVQFGAMPLVQTAFLGVKAAVIIIVLQALSRMAGKALHTSESRSIAILSFLAIFLFSTPFPVVVLAAALFGAMRTPSLPIASAPTPVQSHPWRTATIFGTLWAAPIAVLWWYDAAFLTDLALFFSKLAVVTFGGAYAVLAYMTQTVVQDFGWITTGQMMDALGLAETTPGPLILVTQFVGFLAGYTQGGFSLAFAAAALTLWVTFVPCFLWIFLAGPFIDRLDQMPRAAAALRAITCAVVGVIANLSLWFALHVLFSQVNAWHGIPVPQVDSLEVSAVFLTLLAAYLLLRLRIALLTTLLITTSAAFGLNLL